MRRLSSAFYLAYALEATFSVWYSWTLVRMFVLIKSLTRFKLSHVGSKTRSPGQILRKPCVHSIGLIFSQILMKLGQNFCSLVPCSLVLYRMIHNAQVGDSKAIVALFLYLWQRLWELMTFFSSSVTATMTTRLIVWMTHSLLVRFMYSYFFVYSFLSAQLKILNTFR